MPTTRDSSGSESPRWHPTAALANWVVPGLGHYLIGERRRGSILCASILIIWTAGLLMGGVSVIDRIQNRPWFLGQMLLAPSVAVDLYHQGVLKAAAPAPPQPGRPHAYEPSIGRVQEQGILYTALAGLLNLLTIIDVLHRDPRRRRTNDDRDEPAPAP